MKLRMQLDWYYYYSYQFNQGTHISFHWIASHCTALHCSALAMHQNQIGIINLFSYFFSRLNEIFYFSIAISKWARERESEKKIETKLVDKGNLRSSIQLPWMNRTFDGFMKKNGRICNPVILSLSFLAKEKWFTSMISLWCAYLVKSLTLKSISFSLKSTTTTKNDQFQTFDSLFQQMFKCV